jgi:hypothetical protein
VNTITYVEQELGHEIYTPFNLNLHLKRTRKVLFDFQSRVVKLGKKGIDHNLM